jgi:hypothetical protein
MPEATADAGQSRGWWQWWRDHVVAGVIVSVVAFLIIGGLGALGLWATSSSDGGDTASGDKAVPPVYNYSERKALDVLGDHGFTNIRTIVVCSNSVPEGNVREVLLDKDSDIEDEVVVVNEAGDNPDVKVSPTNTRLLVKVSKGVC